MNTIANKYEIENAIGRGSTSMVYSAIRKDGQRFAIKIFDYRKGSVESAEIVQHFEKEFNTGQPLNHPNIVSYVEWGVHEDSPFLVIAPLAIETLEKRIERLQGLSLDKVDELLKCIAGALDYLRKQQILHRDIKPSNILFDAQGTPFLADFGIAHKAPPNSRATIPQYFSSWTPGTPEFMAPEILEGSPISFESDIYSLALTIYYSLSNQLPSDGDTQHLRNVDRTAGNLIPLHVRNQSISSDVSKVVMKALDKNPRNRFPTAVLFSSAFSLAASNQSTLQAESTKKESTNSEHKTERWKSIYVPILVAVIGAIAAWLAS